MSLLSKCEIRSPDHFTFEVSISLISEELFYQLSTVISGRLRWGCKGKLYFISTKSFSKILLVLFSANRLILSGLMPPTTQQLPLFLQTCF